MKKVLVSPILKWTCTFPIARHSVKLRRVKPCHCAGLFYLCVQNIDVQQPTLTSLPILPVKKFMLPGETSSILVKLPEQIHWLREKSGPFQYLGVPFWLKGHENIFGNIVSIVKMRFDPGERFVRVWVKAEDIFKIRSYRKHALKALPAAHVQIIDTLETPIQDPSIGLLFEKYCNAISLVDFGLLSMLDLIRQLDLGAETSLAIISVGNREAREDLMKKILSFKLLVKQQSKKFSCN